MRAAIYARVDGTFYSTEEKALAELSRLIGFRCNLKC